MCKKLLFLISFVVIFSLVGSAFAADIHVGTAYRNKTIDDGYNAASAGDTITVHSDVAGGTKYYTINADLTKADDSKHDITLQVAGAGAACSPGAQDNIIINGGIDFAYKSGWTVDGLTIQNRDSYGIVVWSRGGFNPDGFTIKNTIITNVGNNAFYYYGYSSATLNNWTWENNTIYNATGHDGLRMKKYSYNWTIKDNLFIGIKHWDDSTTDWGGHAIAISSGGPMVADYCTFYDNGFDMGGAWPSITSDNGGDYGTACTTGVAVNFISTTIGSTNFLKLSMNNIDAVLTGASDGGYRGARCTPEPATIALLGLGGLALLRKRR